jgi:hypothetical protein
MINMINRGFENLTQRSIFYFVATCPSFYPSGSLAVSEKEQKETSNFIKEVYERLYLEPALLGFKLLPDDSLGDKEQHKDKPELATAIRKIIKRTDDFMALLWSISLKGTADGHTLTVNKNEVRIKPSDERILTAIGVKTSQLDNSYLFSFPIITNGLSLLAKISPANVKPSKDGNQKPYLLFSRGVFDVTAPWSREIFGNMLEDRRPFDNLFNFLDQNGYQRIDNKEYDNKISIDYIKNYGNPEAELKAAWGERTRGGIEVVYEELRKNPLLISLRLPYFREILENTDRMSEPVRDFIIATTKKCDGCRYCVQTDKTGKRPFAFITIDTHKLCPMYPGFSFQWRTLENKTTENIIEVLQFIDVIFANRCPRKPN